MCPPIAAWPPVAWLMGDVGVARRRLRRATSWRVEYREYTPNEIQTRPKIMVKAIVVPPRTGRPQIRRHRWGVYRPAARGVTRRAARARPGRVQVRTGVSRVRCYGSAGRSLFRPLEERCAQG